MSKRIGACQLPQLRLSARRASSSMCGAVATPAGTNRFFFFRHLQVSIPSSAEVLLEKIIPSGSSESPRQVPASARWILVLPPTLCVKIAKMRCEARSTGRGTGNVGFEVQSSPSLLAFTRHTTHAQKNLTRRHATFHLLDPRRCQSVTITETPVFLHPSFLGTTAFTNTRPPTAARLFFLHFQVVVVPHHRVPDFSDQRSHQLNLRCLMTGSPMAIHRPVPGVQYDVLTCSPEAPPSTPQ